jgi:hypothetical protein
MKIAFIGAQDKPHELACTHWGGIKAAATRLPHELRVFCCRSGKGYVDQIIEWNPDVIVYNLIDMVHDKIEDARRLRDSLKDAKIVFWYTDCRTPKTGQISVNIKGTVDLFLTSSEDPDGFHEASFGMKPQWLGQAAEPTPKPIYSENASVDFMFIGGKFNKEGFKERYDLIDELERYHGLQRINGDDDEVRAKIYKLMPVYYGSAKFSLDISHFWDIPKYTSNRYWVIPAFWGFGVTKRFPKHEELVPETHHVYWDTIDELAEKMKFYRAHEDERQKMIRLGWEYAKEHHTYEHRINKIIEMVK